MKLKFFKYENDQLTKANDGQELISMTYDDYNFRLITLTEDYV